MIWLKNNWKWLLGVVGTLGFSLLFKKAKDSRDNEDIENLGDKEEKAIKDANDQEVKDIITAGNANAEAIKEAHSTAKTATDIAEDNEEKRVKDLVEKPNDIDDALGEMGITEKK